MKKNRKIISSAMLVLFLMVFLISILPAGADAKNDVDTSEGLKYLAGLENYDVNSVENEICGVETQQPAVSETETEPDNTPVISEITSENRIKFVYSNIGNFIPFANDTQKGKELAAQVASGDISTKKVFAKSLFVGDSIMTGFSDYHIVPDENVVATVGAFLEKHLPENLDVIINANPEVLYLHYGLNEMDGNDEVMEAFIKRYKNNIIKIQSKLKNTKIVVFGLTPVKNLAVKKQPRLGYVAKYNRALQQMCKDLGIAYSENPAVFIDNSDLYSKDGIHFQKSLYLLWIQQFLEEMGLY